MQDAAAGGDDAERLWTMIRRIGIAMVTTEDEGRLRCRPMEVREAAGDGLIWLFTHLSSPKRLEIAGNRQVNLSFAEPKSDIFVSVSGAAEILRDPAKARELWSESFTTWFPGGLADPELALLKVTVERAEYWHQPSGMMLGAYGYLKARLTGEIPEIGDNGKLTLGGR